MKVLLFNGSTRENGCTYLALQEVAKVLEREEIQTEILQLGPRPVRDCIGCNRCQELGRCVFEKDVVNQWLEKAREADGFVFGSPVYFAHPAGQILSVMDRMFYADGSAFANKPAATIAQMPIVSSTYWNMVFGPVPELVEQDQEGLQTMRNLAEHMAWMLRCIEAGKEKGVLPPQAERQHRTNFNR